MHKIAVTGGMGFIGRYVIEEIQSRGYIPVIFDHHLRSRDEYPEDVEVFLGDVRDLTAFSELAAHVDGVIHLAAVLGTQETINDPLPAVMSNVVGGLNFLESIVKYDLPGVYIAVGNYWFNNPYSISKNMVERFCHMYNKDRGANVNIVRAVNAYGPRQIAAQPFAHGKVRKIAPSFICRALSGLPIEIYGDGSQISDMVYVGDVAKALINALEYASNKKTFDVAIEVGPKEHTTVRYTAELINSIAASKGYKLCDIVSLAMRPGENIGEPVTADIDTLKLIGMHESSLVTLADGMESTVQYFIDIEGKEWAAQ